MRALVVGAGAVGTKVSQQLLSSNTVDKILLRDVSTEKLGLASKVLGNRVEVEHFPFSKNISNQIFIYPF